MERIRLTKNEKILFRMIGRKGLDDCPSEYSKHLYDSTARSLQTKGLVICTEYIDEPNGVERVLPTAYGKLYIAENPLLLNPVDLKLVVTIISAILSVVSLIMMFVTLFCEKV